MKTTLPILALALLLLGCVRTAPALAQHGGGGGGGTSTDTIKVSKCYYSAGNGCLLLMASSSNSSAHIYAYRPDGSYLGEVQNGGGGRYGGTVLRAGADPVWITFVSTGGGSITVATAPIQL